MAPAGTTGRITGRRGGRHEEAEYDFLRLVILSELPKGKDEDTFHRELDSIEPDSGVVR